MARPQTSKRRVAPTGAKQAAPSGGKPASQSGRRRAGSSSPATPPTKPGRSRSTSKPDASERPAKSRRSDERADASDASERPARSRRSDASERPSKQGRPDASERPSKRGRPGRPDASERPSKQGRPGRPDASERPSKPRRPAKAAKQQPFAANEREQREGVRLQKFIASSGVCSRRKAEELIESGAVEVNGRKVTELGTRVYPGRDRVVVRGQPITAENKVYFVLNKPDQVVSSAEGSVDDRGRPTVLSLLHGVSERLYPVGRLDYHSRGVLLLTNDGTLAAALTHPRHGVIKTYHVKFQGKLSPDEEQALRDGVVLDDGDQTRPLAELFAFRETDANAWYQIGLTEGLNRQLRRMGDAIGHPVLKLIRVAIGDITADGLAEGEFRPLTPTEVGLLLSAVEPDPTKRPTTMPTMPTEPSGASASRVPSESSEPRRPKRSPSSGSKRPAGAKRPTGAKPPGGAERPGARRPTGAKRASAVKPGTRPKRGPSHK
jgi:23S rRNA pseudouridine2605 synthase